MRATDPIVEEVKRRTDLVALVSEHVALKRAGRGFVGLCPFHQEKTPSFHVNPERGFFHCFGCNAAGDAFTFLMRVTGATFPDALRSLATRAGVVVPERKAREGLDRLAETNGLAAELFAAVLLGSRRGERAREYLAGRGIDLETARRFGLGFAPAEGWIEKLLARGLRDADVRAVGLASPSTSGRGLYPLFRDRLMFPIHDLGGRVIAFGGREIAPGRGPKYLNSPESPLYRKGQHLYGLEVARDAVRDVGRLLLVEGYLDVVSLAQAGVRNVAGVLGTALTVEQLRLARRFAEDIIVCFDGDDAGRRAALRAFPLFVNEADLWPRAVFLPPGEDPDSLVRHRGRGALDALLGAPASLLDLYLDDLVGDEHGPDRTARAATRAAGLLGRVHDPIIRDKIVRGVAGRLGLSEGALLAAATRSRTAAPGPRSLEEPVVRSRPASRFSAEVELIELLLCDRATAERVEREGVCAEIADPGLRQLAELVLDRRRAAEHFDPGQLVSELPRAMAERVARRLAAGEDATEHRKAGEEWFSRRAARLARAERQALISRLRAAEHRGDRVEVAAVLDALRRVRDGAADGAGADPDTLGPIGPGRH